MRHCLSGAAKNAAGDTRPLRLPYPLNDAGQVNISLANVDLTATRDVTITLTSSAVSYAMAQAQIITGPAKDSYNDFRQAETVNIQPLDATSYQLCGKKLKVTLPSKSVVMLTLNPQ
jgi:alpha-L-arabinofuranosidase